jgi:aminoglycoside phosphotransferase (APT) family kinase protein
MNAPDIDPAALARIAARWDLPAPAHRTVPWAGAASQVFPVHDVVVKIPFDRPDAIQSLQIDATMIEFARELGVRAPRLVALDESLEILPVPYAVYRRVRHAVHIAGDVQDDAIRRAWREAGRDLALVHEVRDPERAPIGLRAFCQSPEIDPRPWVEELGAAGLLADADVAWLTALLDRLAPVIQTAEPVALCHGDVNAANVLVHEDTGAFLALVDWGGAGWLDPAWDFAGVSLDVVPDLLAGHREVGPLPDDELAEARICWCQVQTRLHAARTATDPGAAPTILARSLRQVRHFVETGLRAILA